MPELDISAEKVSYIIQRARELEGKVAPFMRDEEAMDEQGAGNLEHRNRDATESELRGFLGALNEDELTNLVALAWVGRGTYEKEEWSEALKTARAERSTNTANYLLETPDIGDQLAAGLDAFGIRVEDVADGGR